VGGSHGRLPQALAKDPAELTRWKKEAALLAYSGIVHRIIKYS
jgi:hypothetical protein